MAPANFRKGLWAPHAKWWHGRRMRRGLWSVWVCVCVCVEGSHYGEEWDPWTSGNIGSCLSPPQAAEQAQWPVGPVNSKGREDVQKHQGCSSLNHALAMRRSSRELLGRDLCWPDLTWPFLGVGCWPGPLQALCHPQVVNPAPYPCCTPMMLPQESWSLLRGMQTTGKGGEVKGINFVQPGGDPGERGST